MEQAMYMQIVPNSHSFGSLSNIEVHYDIKPEELTPEYLLVGFRNTLERGSEIRKIDKTKKDLPIIFKSVADVIHLIENDPHFSLSMLVSIIRSTIASGYDLKSERKMERTEVYDRIDTERQYQDLRWTPRRAANGVADNEKPPAEWINYMEFHLTEAKNAVYHLNDEEALAQVRKVAALAVRCLELHGCPERVIPEELLSQE